jgi:YVTN family beta-propeller protein
MAAALPVTVIAAAAAPASAAGGYTVTATIAVGNLPSVVAVDPTTGTVYVANSGDNTVSVIDEATDTVTATIGTGDGPDGVAAFASRPAPRARRSSRARQRPRPRARPTPSRSPREGAGHAATQRFTLTVSDRRRGGTALPESRKPGPFGIKGL